jgi:hypothetical protein
MPVLPPAWHSATITTIHSACALRDLGLVGELSLAAASAVRFGHDRAAAETTAADPPRVASGTRRHAVPVALAIRESENSESVSDRTVQL